MIYKSHTIGSVYLRSHLQKIVFTDPIENESWKLQMTQYDCPVSKVHSNKVGGEGGSRIRKRLNGWNSFLPNRGTQMKLFLKFILFFSEIFAGWEMCKK